MNTALNAHVLRKDGAHLRGTRTKPFSVNLQGEAVMAPLQSLADGLAIPELQPLSLEREPVFARSCSCWDSRTPLPPLPGCLLRVTDPECAKALAPTSDLWSLAWITSRAGGATGNWAFWGDWGDRDAPCSMTFSTCLFWMSPPCSIGAPGACPLRAYMPRFRVSEYVPTQTPTHF